MSPYVEQSPIRERMRNIARMGCPEVLTYLARPLDVFPDFMDLGFARDLWLSSGETSRLAQLRYRAEKLGLIQ